MKKALAIFLTMAVLVCAVPHVVFAATTYTDGLNLTYELTSDGTNKTATLTNGKNASSNEVEIPGSVNYNGTSYTVTAIGEYAFSNCRDLTSITIPDSVTTVGDRAFYECFGSTSVTIGSGVQSIGKEAFYYCTGLTSVIIPDSVTSIGEWAFNGCSSLESVTIGSGVATIGNNAFSNCKVLKSVTIPNSVTTIGDYAFYYCSGLTSLTIGSGVESIGYSAFANCSGLTSVSVDSNNKNFKVEEGVLFSKDSTSLVLCSKGKTGSYTIPNSVTTIGSYAFEWCSKLTSVTIPDSVTSIGNYAFSHCSGLTSVTIPNSVTSIGDYAFSGCSGLTSINIPNNVTTIADGVFNFCSGLTSVEIPDSVTTIGTYAFQGCSGLTSVTIPASVTSVGRDAFANCSGLKSVNIPDRVTTTIMDDRIFEYCSSLESVTIDGVSDTTFGYSVFWSCNSLASIIVPCDFDKDKFNHTSIVVGDDNTFTIEVGVNLPQPKPGTFVLKHDWGEWETTKEVTCTTDGEKTRSCQREGCGTPETGSIAATGHKLTKTEKREPTCVTEGMNEYWTCSQCRGLFSDSAGKTGITESDLRLSALGHALDLIEEVKATCVAAGTKEHYKCNRCGALFSDENGEAPVKDEDLTLPELGHLLELVEEVKATCVATGTKEHYKCSRCGALFSDENGETPVKDEDLTLPELGHNWGSGEVTTPATPEKPGVKTYICSRCGETKTEPVEYVGIPGGNSNSTNLHQDAERATIKTGDQLGFLIMPCMALLLISAYGLLVVIRPRRKRDRK